MLTAAGAPVLGGPDGEANSGDEGTRELRQRSASAAASSTRSTATLTKRSDTRGGYPRGAR
jgi:hypothetical protein